MLAQMVHRREFVFSVKRTVQQTSISSEVLLRKTFCDWHTTVVVLLGTPDIWISKNEKEKAEVAGYTVIEPPAIIATHLMEVLKDNAYKLLDRQETQRMLDHLKETHSAVVEGLIPDLIPLGVVTQILRNLLKERIPIRNLVLI